MPWSDDELDGIVDALLDNVALAPPRTPSRPELWDEIIELHRVASIAPTVQQRRLPSDSTVTD